MNKYPSKSIDTASHQLTTSLRDRNYTVKYLSSENFLSQAKSCVLWNSLFLHGKITFGDAGSDGVLTVLDRPFHRARKEGQACRFR